MKRRILFLLPVLVLAGLMVWLSSNRGSDTKTPCNDPEYLALKEAMARASLSEKQALLRAKGPLMQFLEAERTKCLKSLAEYTPPSESQRATAIAIHKTQIAEGEKRAAPTPLVAKDYEGPYPTIAIPTVHSDEFLPSPISWRLLWQGELTIIQVGMIDESGVSQGKSGLLIWRPHSRKDSIEIVSLTDKPLNITRLDIVTVCKPFVVVAGRVKQDNARPYIWIYDLSKKFVRSVTRSQTPCWDPAYEQRDPTSLGD